MIAADKWPEWADRHCWDEDGAGYFYGMKCAPAGTPLWISWDQASFIPIPPGHDWRVPVMRHQTAPAIDLEQFRPSVMRDFNRALMRKIEAQQAASLHEARLFAAEVEECRRLLSLIDGHPTKGEGE